MRVSRWTALVLGSAPQQGVQYIIWRCMLTGVKSHCAHPVLHAAGRHPKVHLDIARIRSMKGNSCQYKFPYIQCNANVRLQLFHMSHHSLAQNQKPSTCTVANHIVLMHGTCTHSDECMITRPRRQSRKTQPRTHQVLQSLPLPACGASLAPAEHAVK
jgi:hypothetical protein